MPHPAYQNLSVEFWLHPAVLGTTGPTFCLVRAAIDQGAEILQACIELKQQTLPARLTLTFAPSARKMAYSKLHLQLVAERAELRVMNLRQEVGGAILEMTVFGLEMIISAVKQWLAGSEDFGISTLDSNLHKKQLGELDSCWGELWFWGPHYAGP
jgi:hypothetical protein